MKKLILKTALLAAMATLTGAAQAVLTDQGNGTVLDTNTNLIWLQDWEVNGRGNWATQKTWAEGLTFAGGTDWVLPSISQYADLFTAYGDLTLVPQFMNVQSGGQSTAYWSGTEVDELRASYFYAGWGFPEVEFKDAQVFAVAVRDVSPIPEPETYALMLAGLAVVGAAARRRKAK